MSHLIDEFSGKHVAYISSNILNFYACNRDNFSSTSTRLDENQLRSRIRQNEEKVA